MMEFMTGVKKKETKEITELLTGCAEGEVVKNQWSCSCHS
jgi:hypothetical protein